VVCVPFILVNLGPSLVSLCSYCTMIIENTYGEDVELIPYVGDTEVAIVEYPRILRVGEKGKSVWTFSPNKERTRSLSTMCGFKEIVGD